MYEIIPYSSPHDISYHKYHRGRLIFAWNLIKKIRGKERINILEIGPWTLTYWMRFNNIAKVDTLGFAVPYLNQIENADEHHYPFHLNLIHKKGLRPVHLKEKYDLVVICEVTEHLPDSLDDIFDFLKYFLKPGGRILLQTPNGIALKKRFAMLFGKNPFQLIKRYDNNTFDHIREPAIKELVDAGKDAGFLAEEVYCKNYFDYSHSWLATAYKIFSYLLPKTFKDGITIIFKRIL